jgi:hypothetical protein
MMEDILTWTRSVLKTTPARWSHLAEELPASLLVRPPLEGQWSAVECLQHLVDTERQVFPVRVRYLLAGQDFPAYDPDSQGNRPDARLTPVDLAGEFARLRQGSLALLLDVRPKDLERRGRHQELGIVSLSELLHEWAAHDLMHTVQAERAIMQPFIQGSGPWEIYFRDHIAMASG